MPWTSSERPSDPLPPSDGQQFREPVVAPGSLDAACLDDVVGRLVESIVSDPRTHTFASMARPDRDEIIAVLERLCWLMFPGLVGPRGVTADTVGDHVISSLDAIVRRLTPQVAAALRYVEHLETANPRDAAACVECERRAAAIGASFVAMLTDVRRLLSLDVQAAFDGDPAARHTDEIVICYPGLLALTVHRLSHALHGLGVPLVPRIMSEHAHSRTGIDIHPGATIGRSFFIDHGTGVVIGETTVIGDHCRIYQGVTLGAASFEKDELGRVRRGAKRHPTLEDHVTVYANATILGGTTVIGAGSQVNGGVFLTSSVPPGHVVRAPRYDLTLRSNPDMPPSMYTI